MKALLLFGTEEQKAKWLPRCATGELRLRVRAHRAGQRLDAAGMKTLAAARRRQAGS